MQRIVPVVCLCAGSALAQTGLPDQFSPWLEGDIGATPTQFQVGAMGLTWQQEFTVSRPGTLTSLLVGTQGNAGEDFALTIRAGSAPSSGAALFSQEVTRTLIVPLEVETHVIDLAPSAIHAEAGDTFVLEARGDGATPGFAILIVGSTMDPPLYPHPLFLNASPGVDGARIGFKLYIDPDCDADLTGEGDVNTNDFFAFLALYQAQDVRADFAPDGSINTNDFFAYLAAYQAGC